MRMPYPLDGRIVRDFAAALRQILVLEDKRPFIELFVKDAVRGFRPTRARPPTSPSRRDEAAAIITPDELDRLLAAIPEKRRPLVLTRIDTGMRWGELAALRPAHLDAARLLLRVEETIVEVSRKDSPTGQRYTVKAYPKDDEPQILRISAGLTAVLVLRIEERLARTLADAMHWCCA
jgi:integrase